MSTHEHGIEQIRRLARRAERRLRLVRTLDVGSKALCAALMGAIVVVALRKVGLVSEGRARFALAIEVLAFVVADVVAWNWRLPERAGARALDRFHGLHDRLASALAFADSKGRSAFMDAAIEDAIVAAPGTRPRLAVRLAVPRALAPALGLTCALAAVLLFEVRSHVPPALAMTIEPVEMAPDDLDDVKDFLRQLDQKNQNDETKASIEEFNKLVEDIANKRLDRTEAFRRMEALEEKLLTGSEADKKALEAELERVGDEMKKAELTRPAGVALSDAKLDEARDALHDLAKKLRERSGGAVDKAKLDQMREALRRASEDAQRRQESIEQRRQELADDVLKAKQRAGDGGSDEEQSLLEKKKRELERLDRDVAQQNSASRQLDRLDRELQQAAEDLMKDMGLSADDVDRSAEDLNRMEQGQMTDQQKEELREKLQELRELVRQQGQGGAGQVMRLKRFGRMARGQGGSQGQGGQKGQGQGDEGKDDPGQNGQGQGKGGEDGQGDNGHGGTAPGQGGQGGETWVLGPNGEKMLMLSKGQGSSGQGQAGQGQGGDPGGEGAGKGGREWGVGHDPNLQGKATNPKMGTEDTQVQGTAAQGASRSQVILGAAERGFASRGYKKVYTEYHQVAEESLAKDEIPGGYLFYVKRYFQLIRPRDEH